MSQPGVNICTAAVPDVTCSTGGAAAFPAFDLSGAAYVLYDSTLTLGGGCSGSASFKPAYQLVATDYLQSTDLGTGVCSDQPVSLFTFGVGGLTPPFDVSQLSSASVLSSFAAGFVLVGMFWALGKAVGAIVGMVK